MKKTKIRRFALLALLSISTAGASGGAVYFGMNVAHQNQNMSDDSEIVLPDVDDGNQQESETPLSKTLNTLLGSKEIYDGNISLSLKPNGGEKVNLNLNELNVDLSKINTSIVNLSTDLQVQYGKSLSGEKTLTRLDQTLGLRIENNEACYVSYKNRNFMFNIPQNLSDVMEIVKATGLLVNNAAESTSELDLSSLLSQVQSIAGDITAGDPVSNASDSNLVDMDISIPDITIKNTRISNLKLTLTTTKDSYSLKGVSTLGDGICISTRSDENHDFEEKMTISLSGNLSLREASGYKTLSEEDIKNGNYISMTDANSSVFSTVRDIIGNDADIALGVSVSRKIMKDETEISSSGFDVDGLMQMDINNKKYALSLDHLSDRTDSASTLNSLSMKYMSENAYFQLNDLIKAKISKQNISSIFSSITQITGSSLIETISSQANLTLGSLDIDALKEGDMSQIQGLLDSNNTYFDYDTTSGSFVLSIDGEYLGLTSTPIVLKITCNDSSVSTKGIKEIVLEGLNFTSTDEETDETSITTVTLSLTPQKSTAIESVNEEEYQDMKTTVSLFSSIADVIDRKKFYAEYTLNYKDRINDGTTGNYNVLSCNGAIGADLSALTKKNTLLDTFAEGTYFLKMNANSGNTTHNIEMTYQDVNDSHNLYVGYDTVHQSDATTRNNTVFRNYIENAQLGEMKTILDSKTGTDVSSSLDDTSRILSLLSTSEEFNDMMEKIRKGSLKGLESFVSITSGTIKENDQDVDALSLTIKAGNMFTADSLLGKNLSDINIVLRSSDLSFKSISISTCISSDQEFSFDINFDDYQDLTLDESTRSTYTKIDDATSITKAFYNLANDIKKYGVKIEALYKKNPVLDENGTVSEYGTAVSMSGNAYWDLTDTSAPKVNGSIDIEHPYVEIDSSLSIKKTKANQNLKFAYQNITDENGIKDGQFTADYNDNMHVMLHSSTVTDMVDVISGTSKTNLLNSLLSKASDVVSGMPIKDVISQSAPSLLLSYPYIEKVDINSSDNTLTLQVDKRLFDISSEGDLITLTICYDDQNEPTIESINVDLSKENVTVATASLSLVSYDEENLPSVMEYNDENKGKFVSLDGFRTLVKMAIDTTESNYFHINGYLNLDFTLFNGESQKPINLDALSFDISFDCSLYIDDDGKVNCYLSLRLGDKELTEAGYYVTEFAFSSKDTSTDEKADYVYMNNTRTDAVLADDDSIRNQITSNAYRVSRSEFNSNILYYLVSQGLGIDDRIAGKTIMANIYHVLKEKTTETATASTSTETENASSLTKDLKVSLNSDFSKIFSVYDDDGNVSSFLYDESKQKFSMNLNLNNLLSVMVKDTSLFSFDDVSLKLYHMTRKYSDGTSTTPLYAARMSCGVNVLDGLCKVSLKAGFNVVSDNANNVDMKYVSNDEDGKTYLAGKMERYYSLISLVDGNVSGDYTVSPSVRKKVSYDFSKMELSTFINDYDLNDNGNKHTTVVYVDEYVESDYPFICYL